MNWNHWVRQIHRWLSMAFTIAVIATFIALAQEKPVVWVSYVPLLPLALLLFTGLYLFVLPYAASGARATPRCGRRQTGVNSGKLGGPHSAFLSTAAGCSRIARNAGTAHASNATANNSAPALV